MGTSTSHFQQWIEHLGRRTTKMEDLNNIMNQLHLTDIDRAHHPTRARLLNTTFFKNWFYFCKLAVNNQDMKIKKTIQLKIAPKIVKYLEINLTKM